MMRFFRFAPALIAIAAVVTAIFMWFGMKKQTPSPSSDGSTIDYQNHGIKIDKVYEDYDDYKNDPNNIAGDEVAKAQHLVMSAPIASHFSDRKEMVAAVFEVRFPGYGLTSGGSSTQADGSVLSLFSIEIPQSGNNRYLVFRGGGPCTLVDDFVYPETARIGSVSGDGSKLVYSTMQGVKVIERLPSAK